MKVPLREHAEILTNMTLREVNISHLRDHNLNMIFLFGTPVRFVYNSKCRSGSKSFSPFSVIQIQR